MTSTSGVRVADAQGVLLSTVVLDTLVVGAVIGVFWVAVSWMRGFGKQVGYSLTPLGFSRPRDGYLSGIRAGVAVGVGAVLLSILVKPLSIFVLERLGYSTKSMIQQPFMEGLVRWVRESPGVAVPAVVLVAVLFVPAAEEFVFRGTVYNGLYRLGTWISTRTVGKKSPAMTYGKTIFAFSALASSVLFALLHLELVLVPTLLILALLLCDLFRRTQSLLPCFVAHATFNAFATSVIVLDGLGVLNVPI
jgi:uncharacterized protein